MNTKFKVGELTCMAPENISALRTANKNRSRGVSFISDEFYDSLMSRKLSAGTVTHVFPPGHETTQRFFNDDGSTQLYHMKPQFTSLVHSVLGGGLFIAYPDFINRDSVEEGGSLYGLYRVVDAVKGKASHLFTANICMQIATAIRDNALMERYGTDNIEQIGTYTVDLVPQSKVLKVEVVHAIKAEAERIALSKHPGFEVAGSGS